MQIVIDIPKEYYEILKEMSDETLSMDMAIIKYGTPLPKHHGRLIDADELKTSFPTCDNSLDIKIASVRATINHAPTIIEGDSEMTDKEAKEILSKINIAVSCGATPILSENQIIEATNVAIKALEREVNLKEDNAYREKIWGKK